jgi:hypothetical protein
MREIGRGARFLFAAGKKQVLRCAQEDKSDYLPKTTPN